MRKLVYTLVVVLSVTGCGKKVEQVKEPVDMTTTKGTLVQVPENNTMGELAYVLRKVSNGGYLSWEHELASDIYDLRDQLVTMGKPVDDFGLGDTRKVYIDLPYDPLMSAYMNIAAVKTGLTTRHDKAKLEVMTRLYQGLVLYSIMTDRLYSHTGNARVPVNDLDINMVSI